jgi:hypothetical protein
MHQGTHASHAPRRPVPSPARPAATRHVSGAPHHAPARRPAVRRRRPGGRAGRAGGQPARRGAAARGAARAGAGPAGRRPAARRGPRWGRAASTLVATPERSTDPFTTLGITWSPDPETGELAVAVRTRSEGRWTGWTPLEAEGTAVLAGAPDAHGADVRAGTEPLYAGPSDGVQVRVELLSGQAPRDVRLALVDPGTSPADAPARCRSATRRTPPRPCPPSAAARSGAPTSRSSGPRPATPPRSAPSPSTTRRAATTTAPPRCPG